MPWPRLWACHPRCETSQARTPSKCQARGSVVRRLLRAVYLSRKRTRRSDLKGDEGKGETDAIESTATGIDTAAEAAAGNDIGKGGRETGTRRSHDRDGMGEGTGAGAQVEMEIDTGDTNGLRGHEAGAAVESIGDAVEAGAKEGITTSTAAGLLRGGGAPVPGIDGDVETARMKGP